MESRTKRTWCYVQKPADYDIAACDCGNEDTDWSEFERHIWCPKCERDFLPKHNGIFDSPIQVNVCRLIGISFDRVHLDTGKVELFNP